MLISFVPQTIYGQGTYPKIVRVGWYESTYNTIDKYGRRSGYAYEYQLKLSSYNGWTYEYVEGSWPDLLQMLEEGKIDLMSDVSYTTKREEVMNFASLPMGTEEYYLFIKPGSETILPSDYSTLAGKKVGANKNSIQADLFVQWTQKVGAEPELVEVNCPEEESLQMLQEGKLDAYVTVDSFMDPTKAEPVYKIGSSDYYFAVNKKRPDLLSDLNMAMSRIQDENRYYNLQMYEKYIRRAGANIYISSEETDWLTEHGPIKVGYQDNYLALCASDKTTGELVGVLKDYLELAADSMPNFHLDFETKAYQTAGDAMDALRRGEVDCVFPANLSSYEAEQQGTVMTPPLLDTEMLAIVRIGAPNIFAKDEPVKAAVNKGNTNYEAFLGERFPEWGMVYRNNTEDCLKAVASGDADCLLISNYRFNNLARLCDKYHLTTFSIGTKMDYCMAVKKGRTELYSILAKVAGMVPSSSVNASLAYYITQDAKLTLVDYVEAHLPIVLGVIALVLLVISVLLVQNMRAAKRAKILISATETDDLTGLYNRKFFFQYAYRMYHDHPETPMDAIVFNIEQFHSINALYGRDLGDDVLRAIGDELGIIAEETKGIAGRFEADRFDIYCGHTDDYQAIFNRVQARVDELAPNANIRLRMGVMPYREKLEPVQLFDMARTACNMARGHYNEHLIIYNQNVNERENYEQRLVGDLRHALDSGEFEVYYQPKFDIQTNPPRLASAEALVRWNHSELGMISPGDFRPLFEKNGQIRLLDQYVWKEAAKQISQWKKEYGVVIPVSVNLSRVDVFDPDLEKILDDILTSNGLGYEAFKLEVTESAYTENSDQVIQVVENLRKKGYEVEMDDFGTGYSSLNMLSSMPIDVLKMDREFIRNIEHNEKDIQLVALILDIAKNLKIPVVAEGVETENQLRLLKELGCELVQGYYFSRPLPAGEFEKQMLGEAAN
ncbi:MAG: EAL domain-containing protein [Lachnospiraceae bacterium]|nr:EAL domain-containing protein [Lachnospiraceae bacterium]